MEQPNRQYAHNEAYRFGFNGKENDREWGTASLTQDYGFRLYNPAIAKFLSVDPLAPRYPWYTPYQFAGNMPINSIDLDGLEEKKVTGKNTNGNDEEIEPIVVTAKREQPWWHLPKIPYSFDDLFGEPNIAGDGQPGEGKAMINGLINLWNGTGDFINFIASPLESSKVAVSGIKAAANYLGNTSMEQMSRDLYASYQAFNETPAPLRLEQGYTFAFGLGATMVGLGRGGESLTAANATRGGYVNLASSGRTAHIIAGDATGGGHAWFGSLKSFANGLTGSKSMFPATWSNSKIMHAVSDVAVNNQWIQQTGKAGAMFTKSGQPVRFVVEGTYQGTKIRVITTHADIITAFPIK